jgi:2,3-bisphosphoglycerate-dependent phosphoglycerate mutase
MGLNSKPVIRALRGARSLITILVLGLVISAPATAQRTRPLRIYLARHGQTDWNLEGRTQGGKDIPLNATGKQQAEALKKRLAGVRFDVVYMSNLARSRETAQIVHGRTPLVTLPGLGERRFGKFEGELTSDLVSGPEFQKRMWDPDDSLDGGESLNALRGRVQSALDAIQKQHRSGSVLVVGHSYMNRMLISIIFGLTIEQMRLFDQSNDELYLIELQPGTSPHLWKLVTESNLSDL